MKRTFLDVRTEDLLWEDQTFRSSLERDLTPLLGSLEKVGILVPLRLQSSPDGLRVVSGFLRAEAARSLGWKTLPAELLQPGERLFVLLAALHENNLTRGFTWAERVWVLERVMKQWEAPRDWVLGQLLPAMGLPASPRVLEEHLRVSSIREDLRGALLRQGCSLGNALRVSRMDPQDQELFLELLPSLHLGENLLREFLDLLWEIHHRDRVGLRQLLSDQALLRAMEAKGQDRPQRTSVLRRHLLRIRMPNLSSMEEAFHQARAALGLPPEVSVQHSPHFESCGVTIGFKAKTPKDFMEIARRLWEASQKQEALSALFHPAGSPPGVLGGGFPSPGQ